MKLLPTTFSLACSVALLLYIQDERNSAEEKGIDQ
jgi:hypothetical protein